MAVLSRRLLGPLCIGLAVAVYGMAFMVTASTAMLAGAWWYHVELWDGPWFLTWAAYLIYPSQAPDFVDWLLKVSSVVGALLPVLLLFAIVRDWRAVQARYMLRRRPPVRPWTQHVPEATHGDAQFIEPDEAIRKMGR